MKLLLAVSLALFTTLANAQVLEVDIWKPKMGGAAETMAAAKEAQAIMTEAGGTVSIGLDLDGSVHFAAHHESWADWAALGAKLAKNSAWNTFVARWIDDPSAELMDTYLLNTPVAGGDGDMYQVFIWAAEPGRSADMFQAAVQAKALHEKDGAAVTIHTDQMGHMHYVMNFDSWEAWAAFQDAEHPEFDAFWQERQKDPTARLVKVYTASIQ